MNGRTTPMRMRENRAAAPTLDADPHAWYLRQARLLRAGQLADVDVRGIAEELEDMGRSEAKALRSSLRLICIHLLKWQYQPRKRSKSWLDTIGRERINADRGLRDNPSLRPRLARLLSEAYEDARREAAIETGLSVSTFPLAAPYTPDRVLAEDFRPRAGEKR
jgi:hypothetical protein